MYILHTTPIGYSGGLRIIHLEDLAKDKAKEGNTKMETVLKQMKA